MSLANASSPPCRDVSPTSARSRVVLPAPFAPGERQPVAPAHAERDPVEEGVARELLPEAGGDQDGHDPKDRGRLAPWWRGRPRSPYFVRMTSRRRLLAPALGGAARGLSRGEDRRAGRPWPSRTSWPGTVADAPRESSAPASTARRAPCVSRSCARAAGPGERRALPGRRSVPRGRQATRGPDGRRRGCRAAGPWQGLRGDTGATGCPGPGGAAGLSRGRKGRPATGSTGRAGDAGPQGRAGPAGDAEAEGDLRRAGDPGPKGPAGSDCRPGWRARDDGPDGPTGPAGRCRASGAQGAPGPRGRGCLRAAGATGPAGTASSSRDRRGVTRYRPRPGDAARRGRHSRHCDLPARGESCSAVASVTSTAGTRTASARSTSSSRYASAATTWTRDDGRSRRPSWPRAPCAIAAYARLHGVSACVDPGPRGGKHCPHGPQADRRRRRRPRGRSLRLRVPCRRRRAGRHDRRRRARSAVQPAAADEGLPARRARARGHPRPSARGVGGGRRRAAPRHDGRGDPPGRARGRARRRRAARLRDARPRDRRAAAHAAPARRGPRRRPHLPDARRRRRRARRPRRRALGDRDRRELHRRGGGGLAAPARAGRDARRARPDAHAAARVPGRSPRSWQSSIAARESSSCSRRSSRSSPATASS